MGSKGVWQIAYPSNRSYEGGMWLFHTELVRVDGGAMHGTYTVPALKVMLDSAEKFAEVKAHFDGLIEKNRQAWVDEAGKWANAVLEHPAVAIFAEAGNYFGYVDNEDISKIEDGTDDLLKYGHICSSVRDAWEKATALWREAEEKGGLFNFTAWHRRGGASNHGDAWVVQPDGTRRKRDFSTIPLYKSDGMIGWCLVQPDELAIDWLRVMHLPVNGVTAQQLETVREIERELGALNGAMGLDENLNLLYSRRLDEIQTVAGMELGYVPSFSYLSVANKDGTQIQDWGRLADVNCYGDPTAHCENREAVVVRTVICAGGVLEFLVYPKFGYQNMNLRWRESVIEEMVAEAEDLEDPKPIEDLEAAMRQLQAKFKGLS
ncbi:MAG: hypothetical protein WCG48_02750 [Candidatus Berkelbacteria bacterium]